MSSITRCRDCLVILLLICYLINSSNGQTVITYSFEYNQPQDCDGELFYNSATFQCESCQMFNTTPSTDRLSCVCLANSKNSFKAVVDASDNLLQLFNCTMCAADEVVSRDQSECIVVNTCPAASSTVQRDIDGTPFPTETCEGCKDGTSDSGSTSNSACTFCPTCGCAQIRDGICIDPEISPDPYQPLDSWWMRTKGLAAYYGCSSQIPNVTACQVLTNMCVSSIYDQASRPCADYSHLYSLATASVTSTVDEPRTTNMPWLYYSGSFLISSGLLALTGVTTTYSFRQSGETQLNILAAKYGANGEFFGFEDVANTGAIQLCPNTKNKKDVAFRFGTRYETQCDIPAVNLWSQDLYPTVFYELFLLYEEGEQQFVYPIPIQMTNINNNIVRRFAMVDNLLGVSVDGGEASFVQVASSLHMTITIQQNDSRGLIFVPYLTVTMQQVSVEDQSKTVQVTFGISYEQDEGSQKTALTAYMVTVGVITLIWSFFELGGWRRREGLKYIEGKSFFMLILILFGNLANVMLLVIFSLSIVRFIVYKGQDTVSVVPPEGELATIYIIFICIAFAFKSIAYIAELFQQSSIDIFFIDWEKPRSDHGNKVSGWRTYFVANEFNELQTVRKTSLALQMFLVVLFLEVVGLKDLALEAPPGVVGAAEDYAGVYNKVFRFALLSITYMLVNLAQVLFNSIIYTRLISDCINEFVDLCSVSNVSVLVLAERQHGYYIHGRSVHGTAETDMYETAMNLNKEKENLTSSRGLENGSSLQTFHISIPYKFRHQYDKIYYPLKMNRGEVNSGQSGAGKKFSKNIENTVAAYTSMRNFLISFFDHTVVDMEYFVKDRLFFESLLDMEFQEPVDNAVLYNDPMVTFESKLLYGREFLLMTFELLLIAIIDYGAENFILACTLTYIIQQVMAFIRQMMGRNNLVRKTLVDERFLL